MIKTGRSNLLNNIIAATILLACFGCFFYFSGYLPLYKEQTQLFLFDWNYLAGFMAKPGGAIDYSGAFLIQFCRNTFTGALIYTLPDIAVFILSLLIFRKYKINGVVWALIPVLTLVILQSDYLFNPGNTTGIILILAYFLVCISVKNNVSRYIFLFSGWIFLYLVAGGLSFLATALCIIHEILYSRNLRRVIVPFALLIEAVILPAIAAKTIFFIPSMNIWLDPNLLAIRKFTKYALILFVLYYPVILTGAKILPGSVRSLWFQTSWHIRLLFAETIILLAFAGIYFKYALNPRLNLFFKIDHFVQKEKWDKVLELSAESGETNRLILYYTNLALFKTGNMGNRMFFYNQTGLEGLTLTREGDEISLFLGSRLPYDLGNMNEAYRWAFDAMINNGQHAPRLIRQLIETSLINGDLKVAEKYVNILDHSLYYNKWAEHYRKLTDNPDLLLKDHELSSKRDLLLHTDFVSGSGAHEFPYKQLLGDHSANRMAFDYQMASLLLVKDLEKFSSEVINLHRFGYKELPLHYEEALLMYMAHIRQNVLPAGYGIKKTTVQNFQEWVKAYSSYKGKPENAASYFYRSFGNTYWFYYHFVNISPLSNESNHPFN